MNTLAIIPVFKAVNEVQLCNARDLHARLEVGRDFSNWIKDRIEQYGFVEGEDFYSGLSSRFSPNLAKTSNESTSEKGGRPTIDYHITLDMAKELAMIENNEQGRAVRRYFIQAEKDARALNQQLIEELKDKARHVLPMPGIDHLCRDKVTLKIRFILQDQSRSTLKTLIAETNHAERLNLHYQLRQINDALGIPTMTLEEISAATNSLTVKE